MKDIAFTAKSPTIHIRSGLSRSLLILIAVPFQQREFPPAKEFIVCIKPELFCRPFPTVNSMQTDALHSDPIRTPFRYPLCHLCEKVYLCEAFLWISKMPFKASISPFIATPLPSLTVTLCFHKGEHFPDDAALPQLCGLDRADTSRFIHQIHFPYCADILPRSIHPLRRISPL